MIGDDGNDEDPGEDDSDCEFVEVSAEFDELPVSGKDIASGVPIGGGDTDLSLDPGSDSKSTLDIFGATIVDVDVLCECKDSV